MSTYHYSLAGDFGGSFSKNNFVFDINQSSLSGTLSNVITTGDDVAISFFVVLNAGQETVLNNLVTNHYAGEIYQKYNVAANDDLISSTTYDTYQVKLALTTAYIEEGNYKIEWSYNWDSNNSDCIFEAYIDIDGVTTLGQHSQSLINSESNLDLKSYGYSYQYLSRGVHVIRIYYRRGGNSLGTVYMSNASLVIKYSKNVVIS